MRHSCLFLPVTAVFLFALGCTRSERPVRQTDTTQSTDTTRSEVSRETREAWEAVRSYAHDRKQDLERRMETTLQKIDRDIDAWRARAPDLSTEARTAYHEAAENLRRGREQVRSEFERLKAATSENWEAVKNSFQRALVELEGSLDRMAEKF